MRWVYSSGRDVRPTDLRHEVISYLSSQGDGDLASAELIAGELIGNVSKHATAKVELTVEWVGGQATLFVYDRSERFASRILLSPAPVDSESGRGLAIVKALATEFGIINVSDGTMLIAAMPVWRRDRPDFLDLSYLKEG